MARSDCERRRKASARSNFLEASHAGDAHTTDTGYSSLHGAPRRPHAMPIRRKLRLSKRQRASIANSLDIERLTAAPTRVTLERRTRAERSSPHACLSCGHATCSRWCGRIDARIALAARRGARRWRTSSAHTD